MKGTTLARTLLGLAVLMLAVTALAQDNRANTITINGGRTTVVMKAPSKITAHQTKAPASPFYDNIGTGGYGCCSGWTVSDGSPIGTEYTPGNQVVSLKTGATHKLSVGLGFVTGTNSGIVTLDRDCKGVPCGVIDKNHLCRGTVTNLPVFGSTSTTVATIKCTVKLTKGRPYWVYVESADNSWLAWNLSNTAVGGFIEGTADVWGSPSSGQSVGALTIK